MKRKPRKSRLADQVRQAMRRSGKTNYRLAKETGLLETTLSRFRSDTTVGLRMDEKLDRLFDVLGLAVVERTGAK